MRVSLKTTIGAAVLLSGSLIGGSAMAGADDGGTKAFFENPNPPAVTAPTQNDNQARYRATYNPKTESSQPATPAAKDPQYFYHAMGTMGAQ